MISGFEGIFKTLTIVKYTAGPAEYVRIKYKQAYMLSLICPMIGVQSGNRYQETKCEDLDLNDFHLDGLTHEN